MRWVFLGLGLVGLVFVLVMILVPTDGSTTDCRRPDCPKPGWSTVLGHALSGLAPQIRTFTDGSDSRILAEGPSIPLDLPKDPDRDNRLLNLRLVAGGPVRAVYRCRWVPGSNCSGAAETLCLGALHPDCTKQETASANGSFSVGPGGGSITFINDGANGAQVRIQR